MLLVVSLGMVRVMLLLLLFDDDEVSLIAENAISVVKKIVKIAHKILFIVHPLKRKIYGR
jgi:hypothetical protein